MTKNITVFRYREIDTRATVIKEFQTKSLKPRLHDTAGCQTGCATGLTTGCIV